MVEAMPNRRSHAPNTLGLSSEETSCLTVESVDDTVARLRANGAETRRRGDPVTRPSTDSPHAWPCGHHRRAGRRKPRTIMTVQAFTAFHGRSPPSERPGRSFDLIAMALANRQKSLKLSQTY